MPSARLPLLARNAGAFLTAHHRLALYATATAVATCGVWAIYWPAALIVLAGLLFALVVTP